MVNLRKIRIETSFVCNMKLSKEFSIQLQINRQTLSKYEQILFRRACKRTGILWSFHAS